LYNYLSDQKGKKASKKIIPATHKKLLLEITHPEVTKTGVKFPDLRDVEKERTGESNFFPLSMEDSENFESSVFTSSVCLFTASNIFMLCHKNCPYPIYRSQVCE